MMSFTTKITRKTKIKERGNNEAEILVKDGYHS